MPPARQRGPAPLTEDDVARLRAGLTAGTEPRVQLLVDTAAAPAGTRGPVVALRDASVEPEFIVLRVGGDEVPFSPAELTWPVRAARPRGGAARDGLAARDHEQRHGSAAGEESRVTEGDRGSGEQREAPAAVPAGGAPAPPAAATAGATGAPGSGAPTSGAATSDAPTSEAPVAGAPARSPAGGPAGAATPRRRPRPSGTGAGGVQPFTVTLRFTGTEWTAETTRGGRRGKALPVPVAAVRGFAERLDDPELRRAVLAAVEACREQARTRAERLRAELEQVETVLAQLEDED